MDIIFIRLIRVWHTSLRHILGMQTTPVPHLLSLVWYYCARTQPAIAGKSQDKISCCAFNPSANLFAYAQSYDWSEVRSFKCAVSHQTNPPPASKKNPPAAHISILFWWRFVCCSRWHTMGSLRAGLRSTSLPTLATCPLCTIVDPLTIIGSVPFGHQQTLFPVYTAAGGGGQ